MGYILLLIAGAWWGAYLPTPQRSLRPRHRATTMLAQVPLVVAALAVLGLFALGWGVHAGLVVGLAWVVMGGSMLAAEIFKRAAPALPLLVLFATYLLVTDQSDLLDGLDHGGSLIGLLLMSSGLGLIALTMFLRWRGTVPALEAIGAGQFTQPLGDMKGGLISAGSFTQWLGVEASSCPPPRGLVARIHWLARHRLLPVGNMRLVTLSLMCSSGIAVVVAVVIVVMSGLKDPPVGSTAPRGLADPHLYNIIQSGALAGLGLTCLFTAVANTPLIPGWFRHYLTVPLATRSTVAWLMPLAAVLATLRCAFISGMLVGLAAYLFGGWPEVGNAALAMALIIPSLITFTMIGAITGTMKAGVRLVPALGLIAWVVLLLCSGKAIGPGPGAILLPAGLAFAGAVAAVMAAAARLNRWEP